MQTEINLRGVKWLRFVGYSAAVFVALFAVSGCSSIRGAGGGNVNEKTMTTDQVTTRIEQIIRDTVAAINPTPQLQMVDYLSQPTTCVDPTDGGSSDRTVLNRHYRLVGIPTDRNGEVGQQVKIYWESKGYDITSAVRLNSRDPQITAFTKPDEFSISLKTGGDGSLGIGSTSPCFWPNGTPEPSNDG
jgi:hypothetical protein